MPVRKNSAVRSAGRRRGKRGRPRDRALRGRRREEILCAATRLFAASGYSADLQGVADGLGVAKGTLYRYFPSKRAMFLAAVDRGMSEMGAAVDAAFESATDPLDRLRRAIGAYLRFFREHPELCELLILERAKFRDRRTPTYFRHRAANAARWERFYAGLVRRGVLRPFPVELMRGVIGDLVYGTMFTNFFAGRDRSPEEQSREIIDVVFRGILTPGGCARWESLQTGEA